MTLPTRARPGPSLPDDAAAESTGEPGAARGRWLVPLFAVAALARLFWLTRDYGLLGFDAYPIIATSRIRSFADFLGTFTERLMDGRYPGVFYRPLLNLTIAVDHALWGLDPFGYQLTSVLCLAGCAAALALLARRLAGPGSRAATPVALALVLGHPLLLEVLPVPARRPELLCGMLMGLALWLQLAPRALAARRPPLAPALVALLAASAKETGFVLPALVFVAVAGSSPRSGSRARVAHAAAALVPHLIALGALFAARFAVLGQLGGHDSLSVGVLDALRYAALLVGRLVVPQPEELQALPVRWVVAGAVLAAVAVALGCIAAQRREPGAAAAGRLAAVGGAWLATTAGAAYVAGDWISDSHYLLPLFGWALVVGAAVAALLRAFRAGRRALAGGALLLLALPLGWQAVYSPLVHRYDDWSRGTELQREFLDATRDLVAAAADGTIVYAPALPLRVPPRAHGARLRSATILTDYSVQAWADLVFPDRRVRVAAARGVVDGPGPDEVLVLLTRYTGI